MFKRLLGNLGATFGDRVGSAEVRPGCRVGFMVEGLGF